MVLLSSPLQYIQATPPVTRAFTACTVVFTAFYWWLEWTGVRSTPYLTLIPGSSLFYPWTFATSVFVEVHIVELFFSLLIVPASLRYLERLWGSAETLKFIFAPLVVSNIIAFAFNWIEFMATGNADLFLYGMEYHGQMAIQTAILVAFTQLIPEHQVQLMGVIKTRVKTLPMIYLTFSTVMCLVGYQCPYIIIQFAWLFSYLWLRFYKKNTMDIGTTTYGDRSETFAFVQWFPPIAHRPLGVLANVTFDTATKFHLIPSMAPDPDSGSGSYATLPGPGSSRAEAERRRIMALKALDQRVANSRSPNPASTSEPPSSAPPPPAQSEQPAGAGQSS